MGYDSKVWSVIFWVGVIGTTIGQTVTNPAEYGLPPIAVRWISLIGIICMALGGKLGQSYLKKSGGQP